MNQYKKNNIYAWILCMSCFLTNLSQMPSLVGTKVSKVMSMSSWALITFLIFKPRLIKIDRKKFLFIVSIYFYIIVILFGELFNPQKYLNSAYIRPFLLSMFMLIIGYSSARLINRDNLKNILMAYTVSIAIVCISIYLQFFSQGFNWSDMGYAYTSKNSISQLIVTSIVILYIFFDNDNLTRKIIKWILLSFFILILFMLKSRASILSLIIMIPVSMLFSKDNKKKKSILIVSSLFIIALILNNELRDLIIDDVLLAGRNKNDINDISSGRFQMFLEFPTKFKEHPIIGRGEYFIESFPLCALVQYGILGAVPLFIISLTPLVWSIKNMKFKYKSNLILMIISACYLFNGIFEQLSPFGPGVKNYLLWLLFGLCYKWQKIDEIQRRSDKVDKSILYCTSV